MPQPTEETPHGQPTLPACIHTLSHQDKTFSCELTKCLLGAIENKAPSTVFLFAASRRSPAHLLRTRSRRKVKPAKPIFQKTQPKDPHNQALTVTCLLQLPCNLFLTTVEEPVPFLESPAGPGCHSEHLNSPCRTGEDTPKSQGSSLRAFDSSLPFNTPIKGQGHLLPDNWEENTGGEKKIWKASTCAGDNCYYI